MKQRQEFGKKHDDVVLLSDQAAWEITYRGAKKLPADRVETFQTTTIHDVFYILRARLDEPGMTFESHGTDVVENQPVETIEIYDSENRNVTAWFHQGTLLPVKQRFRRWDPLVNVRREGDHALHEVPRRGQRCDVAARHATGTRSAEDVRALCGHGHGGGNSGG